MTARCAIPGSFAFDAIVLISRSQSRDGGWLYTPDDAGDEGSVTITQVQALRACRDAGISVPPPS